MIFCFQAQTNFSQNFADEINEIIAENNDQCSKYVLIIYFLPFSTSTNFVSIFLFVFLNFSMTQVYFISKSFINKNFQVLSPEGGKETGRKDLNSISGSERSNTAVAIELLSLRQLRVTSYVPYSGLKAAQMDTVNSEHALQQWSLMF